jgi:hypothetical protein
MAKIKTLVLDLVNFANNLVTFAKIQQIATAKLLGRTTAGTGNIEELDIANYTNQLIPLTTTFADCENTTDEIDIVTVTIPANSLAVGDIIVLEMAYLRHQNSGGTINLIAKTILGGSTDVNANGNVTNDAAINNIKAKLQYYAISESGSNINLNTNKSTAIISNAPIQNILSIGATTQANGSIQTSGSPLSNVVIDKTVSNTYKISAKWASANANTYIRVQTAQAYIIKKAV